MIEDNYISDDNNIDENNYSYSKSSKSKKRSVKKRNQKLKKRKGVESSSSSKFSDKIPESFPLILNSEAKYRNSLMAASIYNEYLKNERAQISKHFLKRKLKSAFEREPLDKCKGFFNVPFIPSSNMFSTNTNPNTQQPANIQNNNPTQNNNNFSSGQNDKKINNPITTVQKVSGNPTVPSNTTPRVNNPTLNTNDVKQINKLETTNNPQKKNEIFSTTYRDRIPVDSVNPLSLSNNPASSQSNNLEEKKIDKEIKSDINATKINIPITSINQIYTQPINTNGNPTSNYLQDPSINNTASMIINKLNNSSFNPEENLLSILKESGFTQESIKSYKTGLLQQNPHNNSYMRQQIPKASYVKPNYNISNTQNDLEINNINLGQNYFIDNQTIKTNKIITPNINNINNINNNPLIKVLKDNGSLQILQNIAAQVNSVNTISNSYGSNSMKIKNDIIHNNLDQDLNFQQNPQNLNIIQNYRNSQYINKPNNPTNMYVGQNQHGKNNYTIVNTKANNVSNTQPSLNVDDDILNSFSANNNYE